MLHFVIYPDTEGNWHKYYNRAVCSELQRHGIHYRRLITNFYSNSIRSTLHRIQKMNTSNDDIWLFSTAQNPAIEVVEHKPGRKFGHVHNLECMRFETSRLHGVSLNEKHRLGLYHGVFFSSSWALKKAQSCYPQLADRFRLTGFPMDYEVYQPYRYIDKNPKLVVFNQRLACERLAPLEIEIAAELTNLGYEVQHLYHSGTGLSWAACPLAEQLRKIGKQSGIDFVSNTNKHQYHVNLAKATCVVTTSICDNLPVSLVEAIRLGAVPVAPRSMCFPEFIHSDNLYSPYHLDEIIELVENKPKRVHSISQYDKRTVVDNYRNTLQV